MPYAIDEEKLNDPSMKVMDISKPPMKMIPHQEFPKMVYLHPVDKAKEHLSKIVGDRSQYDAAKKQGYRDNPHVPVTPAEPELESGEYEVAPEVRRGRQEVA